MNEKRINKAEPAPEKNGDAPFITHIETNIFDIEEIYPNCTVHVLKNSVTGEVSVGWWKNEE